MRDALVPPPVSRRAFLCAGLAAATLALQRPADARGVVPRQRVIVDNDFSGDPDGLFQLAHHLASPSVEIPFVIGSHIHTGDFLDRSTRQAENAAAKVRELYAAMQLERPPRVVPGREVALPRQSPPAPSEAARRIINEALRTDTRLPLYYAAGAGLTDLAAALMLEPRIARRMTLVWIGGMEHTDLLPGVPPRHDLEYNLTIDLPAAQWVFNEADIEIWQVPRNVYRQLIVSQAELDAGLRGARALGKFLARQLERVSAMMDGGLGETYILGDSPLVTLTALQSSFEPDSASSPYIIRPAPRIADDGRYVPAAGGRPMRVYQGIDTRLTFADMFAKFAQAGR